MPRLANGPSFLLESLVGQPIRELIGATESPADDFVEMLFLRVGEDSLWHRVFLQAGIGFWERWSRESAFRDYAGLRQIDVANRWCLRGAEIRHAECVGGTWDDAAPSRFDFLLDAGTLRLQLADPADPDSDSVLSLESRIESST